MLLQRQAAKSDIQPITANNNFLPATGKRDPSPISEIEERKERKAIDRYGHVTPSTTIQKLHAKNNFLPSNKKKEFPLSKRTEEDKIKYLKEIGVIAKDPTFFEKINPLVQILSAGKISALPLLSQNDIILMANQSPTFLSLLLSVDTNSYIQLTKNIRDTIDELRRVNPNVPNPPNNIVNITQAAQAVARPFRFRPQPPLIARRISSPTTTTTTTTSTTSSNISNDDVTQGLGLLAEVKSEEVKEPEPEQVPLVPPKIQQPEEEPKEEPEEEEETGAQPEVEQKVGTEELLKQIEESTETGIGSPSDFSNDPAFQEIEEELSKKTKMKQLPRVQGYDYPNIPKEISESTNAIEQFLLHDFLVKMKGEPYKTGKKLVPVVLVYDKAGKIRGGTYGGLTTGDIGKNAPLAILGKEEAQRISNISGKYQFPIVLDSGLTSNKQIPYVVFKMHRNGKFIQTYFKATSEGQYQDFNISGNPLLGRGKKLIVGQRRRMNR